VEAGIATTTTRLWNACKQNWTKLHTKPLNHTCWLLFKQLHRTKKHLSPMERTATQLQHLQSDIDRGGIVYPFTRAPWEKRPKATILSPTAPPDELIGHLDQFTHFTDASIRNGLVGLAVCLPQRRPSHILRVRTVDRGPRPDRVAVELEAIHFALELIVEGRAFIGPGVTVKIASNSQRAIRIVTAGYSRQPILCVIYDALRKLREVAITLEFVWVPRQAGIPGSELANAAAREATEIGRAPIRRPRDNQQRKPIDGTTRDSLLAQPKARQLLQLDQALPGRHVRKIYAGLQRHEATILSQLRTGYSRLNSYLHKINHSETDLCECGSPETVEHFLIHCPQWNQHRRDIWDDYKPELHELCGAWDGRGEREAWRPNRKMVKQMIQFAISTARLDWNREA